MADPTAQEIIDRNLAKLVDSSREDGQCSTLLAALANREGCALMAFIAPYAGVRVSPIEMRSATIGLSEELGIVRAIDQLKAARRTDKLWLLINSPGGYVPSAYKVSKILRTSFKDIKVFVPHMAASGGTLMALSANEIVMGPVSTLTPIDVQVAYDQQYVSAYSMAKALSRLSEYFANITSDEAPYPWRAMTDKLDPVLLEHWSAHLVEIRTYAEELLGLAGYAPDVVRGIVNALVLPLGTHSFVIDRDRASRLKIRLSSAPTDAADLKVMEAWLTDYMLKAADKHVIRFVLPEGRRNAKTTATRKKVARKAYAGPSNA